MARRPEPWYWEQRRGWYVQLHKKQRLLGKAERRTANPPPEVLQEWYRLMAAGGKLSDEERRRATVAELVETYLAWKAKTRRDTTIAKYQSSVRPFIDRHGDRRAADLEPDDVIDVALGQATWGETNRTTFVGLIKAVYQYGRDRGYFEANPLANLDNPFHKQNREHAMTEAEYRLIRDLRPGPEWQFLVDVLWSTGARPGEIAAIEARHLHPTEPIATLAATEHKTGRRSGRNRVIYFPEAIMAQLRRAAMERPDGPLLRNSIGRRWNNMTMAAQLNRWRKKGLIPAKLVLYCARHGFVTRKIDEGHSPSLVSKAVGHANTRVTEGVYYNPIATVVGEVAKGEVRAAVEAEAARARLAGVPLNVDALVQTIVDGVVARIVVNSPFAPGT